MFNLSLINLLNDINVKPQGNTLENLIPQDQIGSIENIFTELLAGMQEDNILENITQQTSINNNNGLEEGLSAISVPQTALQIDPQTAFQIDPQTALQLTQENFSSMSLGFQDTPTSQQSTEDFPKNQCGVQNLVWLNENTRFSNTHEIDQNGLQNQQNFSSEEVDIQDTKSPVYHQSQVKLEKKYFLGNKPQDEEEKAKNLNGEVEATNIHNNFSNANIIEDRANNKPDTLPTHIQQTNTLTKNLKQEEDLIKKQSQKLSNHLNTERDKIAYQQVIMPDSNDEDLNSENNSHDQQLFTQIGSKSEMLEKNHNENNSFQKALDNEGMESEMKIEKLDGQQLFHDIASHKTHKSYSSLGLNAANQNNNLYETSQVIDQVVMKVANAINNGETKIQVDLHPNELGKVEISLETDKTGNQKIQVLCEKFTTFDILQATSKELENSLSTINSSNNSTSLNFGLKDHQQGQNDNGASQQQNHRELEKHYTPEDEQDNQTYITAQVTEEAVDITV